jgi:GntR family carbon starvation induced transcriptional regulator
MPDVKTTKNIQGSRSGEKRETWSEHAYVQLRKDILSGNLLPGSKLKIEQLRERYGVGPTPLREALSRLSSEGLVQIEQLKGFRVATVSIKELEELCEVRAIIESEAIRRSTIYGDEHWEGQIAAAFYKLERLERRLGRGEAVDPDDWEERNREFHDALVAAANSGWLLRLRSQLFDHHERYRRHGRTELSLVPERDVNAEHRDMMEAALARNGDEAARIMREHILGILELLRDRLDG